MALVLFRSPKTGGTSFATGLETALGLGERAHRMEHGHDTFIDRFLDALPKFDFIHTWGSWFYKTMETCGEELLANHRVITMMRNPYDRYISSWAYAKREGWIADDTSPSDLSWMEQPQIPQVAWHHTFRPQINNLYFHGRLSVHQVVRYEHLAEDFRDVANQLGVPEARLPTLNASAHRPWRDYYLEDPSLRSCVEVAIPDDFAALPYSFEQDEPIGPLPRRLKR